MSSRHGAYPTAQPLLECVKSFNALRSNVGLSTALRAAEAIREASQGSLAGSPADDEVLPSEAQKASNSARVDTFLFAAARSDMEL